MSCFIKFGRILLPRDRAIIEVCKGIVSSKWHLRLKPFTGSHSQYHGDYIYPVTFFTEETAYAAAMRILKTPVECTAAYKKAVNAD